MSPFPGFGLYRGILLVIVIFPLMGVLTAAVLVWRTYVFPSDIALLLSLYLLTGLGVTIGYHRMLTHQSFGAPQWLRALFLVLGSMAFEGPPALWAATHIKHHAHSDEDDDPHSPLHGFWHAHLGWMFRDEAWPSVSHYAPALVHDRTVQWIGRLTPLWIVLSLGIPFLLGGWTGLLWGGLVRMFITTHVTWSVNSICHTFGSRAFQTTDESRNEWIIGLLAFGEGWHNNHHAFPTNAFHGMRWWQFDLSGLVIRGLEAVGLIWNVQRVHPETEHAHQTRAQAMWGAMQDLRQSALASIAAARRQWTVAAASYMHNVSEGQLKQWEALQIDTINRLDDMQDAITKSAHLKRMKLLQYQREAERLAGESQRMWARVSGKSAVS